MDSIGTGASLPLIKLGHYPSEASVFPAWTMMYDTPLGSRSRMRGGAETVEPRALERFSETMADEEPEPQMLVPYALTRKTGFYVKVQNVEGLLRMLVFQGPERVGEKPVCVADLLFTRDQFQEMMRVMGMPGL